MKEHLTLLGHDCYAALSAKRGSLDNDRGSSTIPYNGKQYRIKKHQSSTGTWIQYAEKVR